MARFPLAPGSTIGILGGGQLGRMLALSAAKLGFKSHIFAPPGAHCAAYVCEKITLGAYDDLLLLSEFVRSVDVVTYEFENIPVFGLQNAMGKVPLAPSLKALQCTQDRLIEKRYLRSLGLKTPDFWEINNDSEMLGVFTQFCKDGILKTRRLGYDGKGQQRVSSLTQAQNAFSRLGAPSLFEAFIAFDFEFSVVSCRGRDGRFEAYPSSINVHEGGILRRSYVTAQLDPLLVSKAQQINRTLMEDLDYVGVMAVEYFSCGGEILINEIAPRVHNSGHWTECLCLTSQFEQHIRAIAGWPLGCVLCHSDGIMENILGEDYQKWFEFSQKEACSLHLYDKGVAKGKQRKMGHATQRLEKGCLSFSEVIKGMGKGI